jgi:hypothetical protein
LELSYDWIVNKKSYIFHKPRSFPMIYRYGVLACM